MKDRASDKKPILSALSWGLTLGLGAVMPHHTIEPK